MCTHRSWRIRQASRSRQAAQATPKGLLACLVLSECGFANPLLDVNAILELQLYVKSSNLYLKLPFARSEIQKYPFQALYWHVGWSNGLGDSGPGVFEGRC